tara:strand:+ start:1416 stop:1628 length:213 start_codon:yes stop_codon:yes gene_type:complete
MTDWFLEPQRDYVRTCERVKYKTDSRRLKFCTQCKMVWEFVHMTATCHRYEDFPSYGLKRVLCKYCKKDK